MNSTSLKNVPVACAYWEIKPSAVFLGEWCYRRVPGHGFWLWARFAR